MTTIVLLGGSGRIARACRSELERLGPIRPVGRFGITGEDDVVAELDEALVGADVVVNLAGVAHLPSQPSAAELEALVAANVLLPLLLARRGLAASVPLVHVSSSKAGGRPTTAYAWSKHVTDATLRSSFDEPYRRAGLALVVVRPPAVLAPPFDAGRLRHLTRLGRMPRAVVPRIRVPAVDVTTFAGRLVEVIGRIGTGELRGASLVEFDRSARTDLRRIAEVMAEQEEGR